MNKRILSFVLAISVLLMNLTVIVGAFTVTADDSASDLLIADCDTLDGWTKTGGNALTINANGFGSGSKAVACDINNGAFRTATYTAPTPLNIAAYQTLTWDVMMHTGAQPGMWDDIQTYYGDEVFVRIGSSPDDYNVYRLSKMTVTQDTGNNLWYHFSVDLNNVSTSKGNFDKTQMTTFYFTTIDGAVNSAVRNGHIRIDNIYVHTGGQSTNPTDPTDPGLPEPPPTEGVWPIPGAFSRTTTGTFSFVLTPEALDLSAYEKADLYLTLRIYVKNTDGTDSMEGLSSEGQIELTSSGVSDKQEMNWSFPRLNLKSGWNDVRLAFSNAAFDNGLDLSSINYFRLYSRQASDAQYEIKIEDVAITNIKEESIVSTYFADGMMFQQNKPMNVFGNVGAAAQTVKAELLLGDGVLETKQTASLSDGSWSVTFAARQGGYVAYTLRLYVNGELSKTVENILIGELWLAAGQSNMEYFVLQTIKDYDYSLIPLNEHVRFFDEPLVPGGVNSILPATPASNVEEAKWSDGSAAMNVRYVSAIAYYMSLRLQEELDVPVGFINAAKGASVIESWLPREAVEESAVIKETLQNRGIYYTEERLSQTASNWQYLTTLYNAKVAPLRGVNIAGVLWYQGESNIKYADPDGYNTFYEKALLALIDSYSDLFGFEEGGMPFVCAHLAPYSYSSVRAEDYTWVLATFSEMLANVGSKTDADMIQIPIYDLPVTYQDPPINNPDPIHPNSKEAVGDRYATAVLANVYGVGEPDAANAPTVRSWRVDGNRILLTFDNVGKGLTTLGGAPDVKGFAVAGSDRVFVKAQAEIMSADTVAVWNDAVEAPVAATYAWSSFNMTSNLAGSTGIPAVPYRTDTVESVYYLSLDWTDFDSLETWHAVTSLDAGFKPAYETSDNAEVSLETTDTVRGDAAVRLTYTAAGSGMATIAPVLTYGGMLNPYPSYTGLTVHVKNEDARAKQLTVRLTAADQTFYATIVTGDALGTTYDLPAGAYAELTFNFARLANADGQVLKDSATVLKTLTALELCVLDDADGSVLFDDARVRADALPTPGSETDELVDGIEDTTPGSVDADGNMWLSDADTTAGWTAAGATVEQDTERTTQGKASVGTTAAGGVLRQLVYSPGVSLDVSSYDYLEFDIYFSNMAWWNACESMMFELTSSGSSDNESNRYMKGYLRDNVPELYDAGSAASTEPGWYHVKLILNAPQTQARGGLDTTRFNYFRFFTIGAPAGTADFDVRIDNMKFTKDSSGEVPVASDPSYGVVIDDTSMWMTNGDALSPWQAAGAQVDLDDAEKTEGRSSVVTTAKNGVLRQIAFVPGSGIDISGYDYLEFDVYFSNMAWWNASESVMFELTSSGGPDNESNRYMKGYLRDNNPAFFEAADAGTTQPGWYHVTLILNAPQTQARGGLNMQNFNFFRFFAIGAPAGTPDFTVRFDNMKFTKSKSGPVSGAKDPSYGVVIDDTSMWMSTAETAAWWKASGTEERLDTTFKTQGASSISALAKNGVLRQLAFLPDHAIDISAYQYLEFDAYFTSLDWLHDCEGMMFELTSAGTCDVESNRYTRSSMLEACPELAADYESGAPGGKWYHFKLNLATPHAKIKGGLNLKNFNYFRFYTVQPAATTSDYTVYLDNLMFTKGEVVASVIPIDGGLIINQADSTAGWSSPGQEVMLDTVNKVSGKGSVSVVAKNGILKELVYRPSEPVDLTGYHYLQFDLFLSDITCLGKSTGFMVELTSSGTCDVESNRYMKTAILAACPELAQDLAMGDVGNKWYHFTFNLDRPQGQARGGLNMAAMNYFRIYFIGAPAGTPDCIVKLDNLMVTVEGQDTETPRGSSPISLTPNTPSGTNIGNKINEGMQSSPLTEMPTDLINMAIALGGGIGVVLLGAAVFLVIVLIGRKKEQTA